VLPPWIFDYPAALYAARDEALSRIDFSPETLRRASDDGVNVLALSLASGVRLDLGRSSRLAGWERTLYDRLMAHRLATPAPSLPAVFLGVFSHFRDVLSGAVPVPEDFTPSRYSRFLFIRKRKRSLPLGVYDPLGTVHMLIDALSRLWSGIREAPLDFRYFKLRGAGLLKAGETADEEDWTTLLAYCGGCGDTPLVYGSTPTCPKCRWLKCRLCGTCECSFLRKARPGSFRRG
jgi:hypothetical protein